MSALAFIFMNLLFSSSVFCQYESSGVESTQTNNAATGAGMSAEAIGKQEMWGKECADCASPEGVKAIKAGAIGTGGAFGGYVFSGCSALVKPPCGKGVCCPAAHRTDCIARCEQIRSISASSLLMGTSVALGLGQTALNVFGNMGGGAGSGASDGSGSKDTGYKESKTDSLFSGNSVSDKCGKLSGVEQKKCYCDANGWKFDTAKGTCDDSSVATTTPDADKTDPSLISSKTDPAKTDSGLVAGDGSTAGSGSGAGGAGSSALGSLAKPNTPSDDGSSVRALAMANKNKIESGSASSFGGAGGYSGSDDTSGGAVSGAGANNKDEQKKKQNEIDKRIEIGPVNSLDLFLAVNKPIRIRYDYNQIKRD